MTTSVIDDSLAVNAEESGWTTQTLKLYFDALRMGDDKFAAERDRRYTEVALEREKALKIKETADLAALQLAREIQTYKDEKANDLRSQIEHERGSYATQFDLKANRERLEVLIQPALDYVTRSLGGMEARSEGRRNNQWGFTQIAPWIAALAAVGLAISGHVRIS